MNLEFKLIRIEFEQNFMRFHTDDNIMYGIYYCLEKFLCHDVNIFVDIPKSFVDFKYSNKQNFQFLFLHL